MYNVNISIQLIIKYFLKLNKKNTFHNYSREFGPKKKLNNI